MEGNETVDEMAARGKDRFALYCDALVMKPTHDNATAFVVTARNASGLMFYGKLEARLADELGLLLAAAA